MQEQQALRTGTEVLLSTPGTRSSDETPPPSLTREEVRRALLAEEQDAIAGLAARLRSVEGFHGNLDERKRQITDVLVGALDDVAHMNPTAVSEALGPAIGDRVRLEVSLARDDMIAALRPLAGQLVIALFAEGFAKLNTRINRRISTLTSRRGLLMLLKSIATGRSVESLLSEAPGSGAIRRVYLFDRMRDELSFFWPNVETEVPPTTLETDTIRAAFAKHMDAGEIAETDGAALVEVGDEDILVYATPERMIAVTFITDPDAAALTARSAGCVAMLDATNVTPPPSNDSLNASAAEFFANTAAVTGTGGYSMRTLRNVALGLAFVLVGLVGWRIWDAHRIADRTVRLETALSETFAGEQVLHDVTTDRGAGEIRVRAIGFAGTDPDTLTASLGKIAAPYTLMTDLRLRAAVERQTDDTNARIVGVLKQTREALAATRAEIAALRTPAPAPEPAVSPETPLEEWIAQTVIAFGDADILRDDAAATDVLEALAARLNDSPDVKLGIAGTGDANGSDVLQRAIARARSLRVAEILTGFGVSPDRLSVETATAGDDAPPASVTFTLGKS